MKPGDSTSLSLGQEENLDKSVPLPGNLSWKTGKSRKVSSSHNGGGLQEEKKEDRSLICER